MNNVDDTDLRIISHLLDHPRASYAELARNTQIGETTARRRVEALIESQTLTPAMIPDLRELGFEVIALVGIKVDLSLLDDITEQIQMLGSVTSLHVTMGRYDLIATVAEPTLDDLRRLIVNHIASMQGVRDTETFVSSRSPKILRDWRLPEDMTLAKPQVRMRHSHKIHEAARNAE